MRKAERGHHGRRMRFNTLGTSESPCGSPETWDPVPGKISFERWQRKRPLERRRHTRHGGRSKTKMPWKPTRMPPVT